MGQTVFAELTPDQVLILANRNSPGSLAVARHFAVRRNVPAERILQLDLPLDETISRGRYERNLVIPTRQFLETQRLTATVRVVVTTYGIPLRVEAPQPTDQEKRWRKDAAERQRFARAYLEKVPEWAIKIAPSEGTDRGAAGHSSSQDLSSISPSDSDHALLDRINAAVGDAASRIQQARDRTSPEKVIAWTDELARLSQQAGGIAALVQNLQFAPSANQEQVQAKLAQLKQQVTLADTMLQALTDAPSDANRKRAFHLAERMFGLQGILRLATSELQSFSYEAGDASVDSELSLLWWDPDLYRIAGRMPNPLHYGGAASTGKQIAPLQVLMVSRLDASTSDFAKRLVDQSIDTEQHGLSGKIYVDAQGLKSEQVLGYRYYDQSLRDLAEVFRRRTSYPVISDNTERRFSQPGEAPDVAVYVGWYKLRSYEDAFIFLPGAIGYHIASAEAISIHNPMERGWCKNALDRGITVTLGSTGEPYLDAFPLPSEFFALLLTGRYSLVEAYAMTSRYTSWRMVLFGDPFYNPWRGKGLIDDLGGLLRSRPAMQSGIPPSPSTFTFSDPIETRRQVKQARKVLLSQVSDFLARLDQRSPRTR